MGSIMDFVHNRQEFTSGPLTLDEIVKILSLFNNPKEAEDIRRALRFYSPPKAETLHPLAKMLPEIEKYAEQFDGEYLKTLLANTAGKKAVLYVGAGVGGTLKRMAAVMPKGALLVAVEAKDQGAPDYCNPTASLKETCRQLSVLGANVQLFIGDAKSSQVISAVESYAPYDFIFVNGDDVDFHNYAPFGYCTGRVQGSGIEVLYRE